MDTIYALSSGSPPAAIAVVRVSGPAAAVAVRTLAGRLPQPRRATLRPLRDADGRLLDRALLLWFPAPASATGEDLAELHLHGGRATVAAVLAALDRLPGLRAAEGGEFTRRALANGRIDLAEAEGLADLLAAETEGQRLNAVRLAEGGLGALVAGWRETVLTLAAEVEATIEFGEEDGVALAPAFAGRLAALRADVARALATPPAERLRDGVRVLIAGPPNAGKSTLLNALAGRPAAIATPVPGTTRDLIEVPVVLGGVGIVLIDSAGLRDSTDPIERVGVERARAALAAADLVLWLGATEEAPDGNVLRVAAKSDLRSPAGAHDVAVSAATGAGLTELVTAIIARAAALLPGPDQLALAARHRALLRTLSDGLAGADQEDLVLAATDLHDARVALDRLTGRAGVEDMLDALFARFCVGK